jgi:uncharacterized cupredoxin-like copper-binding protein
MNTQLSQLAQRVRRVHPAALTLLLGTLFASACGAPNSHRPPTITEATIVVHHSHFEPARFDVPAGVPITITLRNDDPIEHEWIAGPPSVHAIHRTGTEAYHEGRPNEITLLPYSTHTTTLTFDSPGDYLFICHLPGHESYGMTGLIRVLPT